MDVANMAETPAATAVGRTGASYALVKKFSDFLDADAGAGVVMDRVREMLDRQEKRLSVDMDEVRESSTELARGLLVSPIEYLSAFELALQEIAQQISPDLEQRDIEQLRVGLSGTFGRRRISPRALSSQLVGGLVCLEGIITRCSTVRPKLVKSVQYCPETNKLTSKSFAGMTSLDTSRPAGGGAYLTRDDAGRLLETEFGLCQFRDNQRVTVQEMPERAPAGQIPRSVDVILEGDLVDYCKPGDRVRIVGVYRAVGGLNSVAGSGVFKTLIWANSVATLNQNSAGALNLTEKDISNIRQVATLPNLLATLSRSIAPSISGLPYIKKAILLLLLGGAEKNLKSGTHLRGDINMLMVGDPSTAKSQLLRFVLNTAPLAISTTGRGSSGVGLTAAVTRDVDTGERHLEAGAMVLADRGVVCIDEFDKMSDEDRVAIHEVMEQQTVTIAKAGIHASLNARCSVVAAANPLYGSYDRKRKPHENIALPDSLLSRFDLLFIVLDMTTPERDREIADHVLRSHVYRQRGIDQSEGGLVVLDDPDDALEDAQENEVDEEEEGTSPVYEKRMKAMYKVAAQDAMVTVDFLQKYIHYAKQRIRPVLSEVAAEFIAKKYRDLRSHDANRTLPITARCLETMIRLATAHAKSRLCKEVEELDAKVAFELVQYALYHQAEPDKKKPVPKSQVEEYTDDHTDEEEREILPRKSRTSKIKSVERERLSDDSESDSDDRGSSRGNDQSEKADTRSRRAASSRRRTPAGKGQTPYEDDQLEESKGSVPVSSPELLGQIRNAVNQVTSKARSERCSVDQVEFCMKEVGFTGTRQEVLSGLEALSDTGEVMVHDEQVFRV